MSTRTVLLAEADVTVTVQAATHLIAAGYAIETATTVTDALARLLGHSIDLLIVSDALPGGGVNALLSSLDDLPCPVVVLAEDVAALTDMPAGIERRSRTIDASDLTALAHRLLDVKPHGSGDCPSGCRALVVEDDPDHRAMIHDCLARNGREEIGLVFAGTVAEACEMLAADRYDFVLLDHNLPDGSGFDVLERMSGDLLTTPVIGLSTSRDPEVALGDFRGGALEFIEKHEAFRGETLRRRVFEVIADHKRKLTACAIERRREQMTLSGHQEKLMAEARMDGLLGIFNRSAFDEYLNDVHNRAVDCDTTYALCMVDVDHFKRYNDHYGHARGDDVLRNVTGALQSALREGDFIARWGGEEIAIVIEQISDDVLRVVLDRCCSNVANLGMTHERTDPGDAQVVTVSIGATTFDPSSGNTMDDVFERADCALYEAKANGRNRVIITPPDAPPDIRRCA